MPKQPTAKKTPAGARAAAAKKPRGTRAAQRPAAKTGRSTGKRKAAPRRPVRKTVSPPAPAPSLGRPTVTGEEKLYLLFKEDYHARQIFEFLGVETVKELERFSAKEIVRRLSQPITKTVDRIRRKLAEKKRCLLNDEAYALQQAPAGEAS